MSRCPKCNVHISDEIEQYGGECPNCFTFLDGSLGENDEFEPTGMFTREQLAAFMGNQKSTQADDDLVEDLLTDEVDLDDVLAFEDDVTEIIEPTEPIASLPFTQVGESDSQTGEHEEDDGFDFDDEPTVALNPEPLFSPESSNETLENGVSDTGSVDRDEDVAPVLEVATPVVESVEGTEPQSASPLDNPLPSDDKAFGQDVDDPEDFGIGGESVSLEEHANPLEISPKTEGVVPRRERTPIAQKQQKSFNWKPIVATLFLVGVAAAVLLPKEDQPKPTHTGGGDHEISVAKVEAGALKPDEPQEKKVVQKAQKTQPRKTSSAPKPVEKSGVRTFQTAAPTSFGTTAPSQNVATGQSAKLERDVGKLKKSLQYCHTKALKTDPTVSGKWEVQFKVSSGKASGVRIKAMRSANSDIESCMKTKIQRFSFSDSNTAQNFKFRVLFER